MSKLSSYIKRLFIDLYISISIGVIAWTSYIQCFFFFRIYSLYKEVLYIPFLFFELRNKKEFRLKNVYYMYLYVP